MLNIQNVNNTHFPANRVLIDIHFFFSFVLNLTFYHTIGLFNSPKIIYTQTYLFILQCLQHEWVEWSNFQKDRNSYISIEGK